MKYLLIIILLFSSYAFSENELSILFIVSDSTETLKANDYFMVEVRCQSNENIAKGIMAFISFDQEKIQFISGTTNTAWFDNTLITNQPECKEPGIISFSCMSNQPINGNYNVASLKFKVIQQGRNNIRFLQDPPRITEIIDGNFNKLNFMSVHLGLGQKNPEFYPFKKPKYLKSGFHFTRTLETHNPN